MPFLNKLRKSQIKADGLKRYLVYALGEILLLVIGILIALKVNNWNEERQQDAEFYNSLPKVYNEVYRQYHALESFINVNQNGLSILDSLLYHQKHLSTNRALHYSALFTIEFAGINGSYQLPKTSLKLQPNPERQDQIELNQQIISVWNSDFESIYTPRLKKIFESAEFPVPEFSRYLSLRTRPDRLNSDFFTEADFKEFDKLKTTRAFINALKTERGNTSGNLTTFILRRDNCLQALKAIKAYRPDVKVSFEEIGIVGDATGSWDNSIPMKPKPGTECTWELDTDLKDGYVKFRSHNTWEENWGGFQFPKGNTEKNGDDIPVKKGRYHIEIDLVNLKYSFTPLQ